MLPLEILVECREAARAAAGVGGVGGGVGGGGGGGGGSSSGHARAEQSPAGGAQWRKNAFFHGTTPGRLARTERTEASHDLRDARPSRRARAGADEHSGWEQRGAWLKLQPRDLACLHHDVHKAQPLTPRPPSPFPYASLYCTQATLPLPLFPCP
jgi:hypothetical protein